MKRTRWIKRIILTILTIVICSLVLLSSYVIKEEQGLQDYATSLSELPEVERVEKISTFSGDEFYHVAKVKLKNETIQYYFIKDNEVVHYENELNLMPLDKILTVANSRVSGVVKHHYLGMFEERPIYEVLIGTTSSEVYVLIDAKSGEVIKEIVVE